tara:strand:- start:416 stop:901 length:486 start_codon:yes stop_codon:yes gene_type:complete
MTRSIDFYFDFISPYSYIAYKKIELLKSKNINFRYKPILLGGLHKLEGITAPAFIKSKLENMINDCTLISKKNNISFIWNSKFPINSLYLMRGYLLINDDLKNLYFDTMFNAYWRDNIDISNNNNLINLVEKCKINKKKFFDGIENQKIKDDLKKKNRRRF